MTALDSSKISEEGYLNTGAVSESVASPEVEASDIENEAAGPAVGAAEEAEACVVKADSNLGRSKSDS